MNQKFIIVLLLFNLSVSFLSAQDSTWIKSQNKRSDDFISGTFNSNRIVNGQSTLNPTKGSLFFMISHQFGSINEGGYNFFGLDRSTIRLGFEYGINDYLGVGIGRSSMNKTFDGFIKFKLLNQKTGAHHTPISLTFYSNLAITSLKWTDPDINYSFKNRVAMVSQLLISSKLNSTFSIQLSPTYIRQNPILSTIEDKNTFALGLSGRKKLSKMGSLVFEYFYLFPGYAADHFENSLSIGFNIETLGHIFQVFLTNSQGLYENSFITHTNGKWLNGDIHIGFNIVREFQIRKMKNYKKR
jgi:hypothetical protein